MKKFFASVALAVFASGTILATDLVNKDGKKYEVKVHEGVGTTNITIDGSNTRAGICSRECTIEVAGAGAVKITGKEKSVTIENGKLSVVK